MEAFRARQEGSDSWEARSRRMAYAARIPGPL